MQDETELAGGMLEREAVSPEKGHRRVVGETRAGTGKGVRVP